jgi:hypothetical protein
MIPVLGLPILNRYDLAHGMERSVDVGVERYYVLDNGGGYVESTCGLSLAAESIHICKPGFNLGWGAAVNFIIRANLRADWWCFANADTVFGPGDLDALEAAMWAATGPAMVSVCGYSGFAVNDRAIEAVGWFDEHYIPCYCEDSDWDWRAKHLGVSFTSIASTTTQAEGGSVTIRQPGTRNNDTYPLNKDYHRAKWGGEPWEEQYATPWNLGGDLTITTAPKLSRLREQSW